jgi:hypothetical protein
MSGAEGGVHLTINSVGNWENWELLEWPGRVYEIIGLRRLLLVKTAPTGIITTIARLGNASRERKSASVFATPDK